MRISPVVGFIALLLDLLLINFAFLWSFNHVYLDLYWVTHFPFFNLLLYFNALWLMLSVAINPYRLRRMMRVTQITGITLLQFSVHAVLMGALYLFQPKPLWEPRFIGGIFLLAAPLLFAGKITFLYALRYFRLKGQGLVQVAVWGSGESVARILRFFDDFPEYGYRNNRLKLKPSSSLDERLREVETLNVEILFVDAASLPDHDLMELFEWADRHFVRVHLIAPFVQFSNMRLSIQYFEDIPVMIFQEIPLDDWRNRLFKRVFDVVGSLLVIFFLLSWMYPLFGLIIALQSKGPILFKQKRSGLNNQSFTCYKFRSMVVNAQSDLRQASDGDARITPFGRFLRRTSLDELPQFINVLVGDMSIVGPRPHMLKHTQAFSAQVDRFMTRHRIKPGITGLAQVRGYRGETPDAHDVSGRVRLDRFYVNNWTFLFDVKITLDTIRMIFRDFRRVNEQHSG